MHSTNDALNNIEMQCSAIKPQSIMPEVQCKMHYIKRTLTVREKEYDWFKVGCYENIQSDDFMNVEQKKIVLHLGLKSS